MICLNKNFSTTRLLVDQPPCIKNKPVDTFDTVLFLPEDAGRKGEGGLRTRGYFKQNSPHKPLVSIITVVLNGKKYIEETIETVINQHYDNIEYIIIDGGSTDGTIDIIKGFEGQVDYWVSEKDEGIYDAMNKGIRLSCGSIIGIVNAGDGVYKKTMENVSQAFVQNPDIWYTYGTVDFVNETGKIYCQARSVEKENLEKYKFKQMPYPHPTMYVAVQAYKEIGLFDLRYKLRADYDFLLKLIKQNKKSVELMGGPVGFFRSGGQSGGMKTYVETRRLLKEHGLNKLKIEWYFVGWMMKLFLVTLLPYEFIRFLSRWRKRSTFQYF